MTEPTEAADRPSARWFVPALVVGWSLIGVGVWSALQNSGATNPRSLFVLVVELDLAHDLILAPLLILGSWLIARVLPAPARGPCRVAGALTVLIALFSYPLVTGWGRRPTNSSTLPHDYGRTVLILLAAVWLVAAVSVAVRIRRRRT